MYSVYSLYSVSVRHCIIVPLHHWAESLKQYLTDNNQDELIINYNLLKNFVYESCTAYDKVFPPVTHFYRRSSS